MTLLFKRTDPFIHVFVIVSVVLSGIFFPLRWFSAAWENLATFMPLTLTVEGVRALVMYEKPLSTQTRPLLGLALYAALLLPIAGFTLRQVIKKRKNDNSSGYY